MKELNGVEEFFGNMTHSAAMLFSLFFYQGSTVSREASDKEKVWTIPGHPFLPPGGWKQMDPTDFPFPKGY